MDTTTFAYWLKGLYELTEGSLIDPTQNGFTPSQARIIKDHLDLCFTKVTPDRSDGIKVTPDGRVILPPGFQAVAFDEKEPLPGYPDGTARGPSGQRLCGITSEASKPT